jgi:twitching motility protein PilT
MINNDAISNLIREGKAHMIDNIISTSAQYGMISIEKSIANLILSGDITVEDGLKYALKPQEVRRLISKR